MEVTLRAPEPRDLDCLYRWENDPAQWRNTLSPAPLSRHVLWHYLDTYDGNIAAAGQLRLMIEADGVTVGTVDLCDYSARNATAFVSIYVDAEFRTRGVGAEALRQVEQVARVCCGIRVLAAMISGQNTVSQHLFASAGYQRTGTLPQWLGDDDILLYVKCNL